MKFFKSILDFLLCFLRDDCPYSIKKLLTYVFSGIVIYLAIFTDKDYYQLLMFVGVLLGIRAYEKGTEMKLGYRRFKSPLPAEDKKEVL